MSPRFPLTLLLAGLGVGSHGPEVDDVRRSAPGSLVLGPRPAPHDEWNNVCLLV
jgi:hypothetical protein